MASNPTRKTEVQAYSFEVRRMNSALVRRDPVMLHDPLRTHSRATIVGVVLGMVGLLGFLIFGILKPNATPPDGLGIVIGKETGQIYVYVEKPEKLIPTFNLASARLILMGEQQKAAAEGGGAQEAAQVVQPTVIPDDRLKDIPRGRLQGIPGAEVDIPGAERRISDNWAVCHNLPLDESLEAEEQLRRAEEVQETAVLAGLPADQLGKPLATGEAIYVKTLNNERYLLYRPEESINQQASIVRAKIPEDNPVIAEALQLDNEDPRPMSLGLLNSIKEVDTLVPPEPPGKGQPSAVVQLAAGQSTPIGEVFVTNPTGDARYFVVLENGKQEISQAAAELIRLTFAPSKELIRVGPDRLSEIKNAPEDEQLPLSDYPERTPEVIKPLSFPTTCLGWTVKDGDGRTTLYVGRNGIPFPKGKDGQPQRIKIGKANELKIAVNYFYMPPGLGAAVHSATSKDSFKSGPIQLISDRGHRYGVPDTKTAQGLGLNPIRPAPEGIVSLLPTGTSLNVQAAQATYDSVETAPDSASFDGQTPEGDAPGAGG